MFKSFSIFTKSKYSFDGQKHYETVQALLYRHWFTILIQMIAFALLALIPVLFYKLAGTFIEAFALGSVADLLGYIYYLIWWYGLFKTLTMYVLDTWVVTDHRIIDSQQKGLFRRDVSEMNLSKMQDISVELKGLIPTFLDFGNLEVQTAGREERFLFQQIPHPNAVKDLIMHAHNEFVALHKNGVEVHEKAGL